MAIEYLKKFFGEDESGNPVSLTFEELSKAVEGDKDLKLYNLAEGGYVSKDKLDGKIAELSGIRKQLEDANKEIQSYREMDIEGIKKAAETWEQKYKADTEALEGKIAAQEYEYKLRDLANGIKFSSASAKKAFLADVMTEKLGMKDGDIMGFDDYVAKYRASDPDAFEKEAPPVEQVEKKPKFSDQKAKTTKTKLSLTELMSMANEGKDVSSYI